jgi:hypothetical protein
MTVGDGADQEIDWFSQGSGRSHNRFPSNDGIDIEHANPEHPVMTEEEHRSGCGT